MSSHGSFFYVGLATGDYRIDQQLHNCVTFSDFQSKPLWNASKSGGDQKFEVDCPVLISSTFEGRNVLFQVML